MKVNSSIVRCFLFFTLLLSGCRPSTQPLLPETKDPIICDQTEVVVEGARVSSHECDEDFVRITLIDNSVLTLKLTARDGVIKWNTPTHTLDKHTDVKEFDCSLKGSGNTGSAFTFATIGHIGRLKSSGFSEYTMTCKGDGKLSVKTTTIP